MSGRVRPGLVLGLGHAVTPQGPTAACSGVLCALHPNPGPPCLYPASSPGPSLAQRLEPLCDHLSIARLPEVLPQLR